MTKIHIPTFLLYSWSLTNEQIGLVTLLALHYAEHGEIPSDDVALARVTQSSLKQWRKQSDVVLRAWKRMQPKLFKKERRS